MSTKVVQKEAFDVTEAMQILGISRQTLYDLLNSGELRSFILGRRRRKISRRALEEYIAKAESGAA